MWKHTNTYNWHTHTLYINLRNLLLDDKQDSSITQAIECVFMFVCVLSFWIWTIPNMHEIASKALVYSVSFDVVSLCDLLFTIVKWARATVTTSFRSFFCVCVAWIEMWYSGMHNTTTISVHYGMFEFRFHLIACFALLCFGFVLLLNNRLFEIPSAILSVCVQSFGCYFFSFFASAIAH